MFDKEFLIKKVGKKKKKKKKKEKKRKKKKREKKERTDFAVRKINIDLCRSTTKIGLIQKQNREHFLVSFHSERNTSDRI